MKYIPGRASLGVFWLYFITWISYGLPNWTNLFPKFDAVPSSKSHNKGNEEMVSFWLAQWWYIICGFHVSSFPHSYVSYLISYVFCDVRFKFNMFGIWKTSFLNTEIAWSLLIIADVDHKRLLRIHNTPHIVVFLHLHYLNFKNKPM